MASLIPFPSQRKHLQYSGRSIRESPWDPHGRSHEHPHSIHRLPTKKPSVGAGNAPEPLDPIIVRFMKMSDRDRVLRAFEQPRQPRSANGNIAAGPDNRITVRTDLQPKMTRERGRLASVAYKLRKTKQLKTKIVIHAAKVLLQTKNPNEPSSNWKTWSE